jgi:hypothetical protein
VQTFAPEASVETTPHVSWHRFAAAASFASILVLRVAPPGAGQLRGMVQIL